MAAWAKGVPAIDGNTVSWGHHVKLLALKDPAERQFYLAEATRHDWGRDTLRKAIKKDYRTIITNSPKDRNQLKRHANPLYVYKAFVEDVIDGDTLLIRIDLGFHTWTDQRIRLRGVDTKELSSDNHESKQLAEKAKTYVENKLKDIPFVVLKTYKTDIYGRFVADVFYHPTMTKKEMIAITGFYLNQEIIDDGVGSPLI